MRVDVLYLLLVIVCVLQLGWLSTIGWRARHVPGGRRFAFFCAMGATWSTLVGAMAVTPPDVARFLLSLKYIFIALGSVSLFLFVSQRTGRLRRLSPPQQRALFVPPLLCAGASFRDGWGMVHSIQWSRAYELTFIQHIGFGPVYWLFTAYLYAMLLSSIAVLLSARRESAELSRSQSLPMLVGVCAPVVANVLLISGIAPRAFDPMPIGLAIAGGAWWWGAMRHHLLDLVPIARHVLVDELDDGILILDARGRVLDLNDRLAAMCDMVAARTVGMPIEACTFGRPELRSPVLQAVAEHAGDRHDAGGGARVPARAATMQVERDTTPSEVRAVVRANNVEYELRARRLPNISGASDAIVLLLHDVTTRMGLEREQRRLIDELQSTLGEVRTLRGLLPICAGCKQIRDDRGTWHPVEEYIRDRTHAEFSHGLCPGCLAKWYPDLLTP